MAEERISAKIRWPLDGGQAAFANNVVLASDQSGTVYISFFQANPPLLIGDEDRVKELTSEAPLEVDVVPIARIAMSRSKATQLIDVLKNHLERQNEPDSDLT